MQLQEGERIDDLQYKGLKILQHEDGFRFGTDAVILAGFAHIQKGDYIADLGTGSGVIPILLSGRTEDTRFVGVEIQKDMANMAKRSVVLNELSHCITIWEGDLKLFPDAWGKNIFNVVVCNPPYQKVGSGEARKNQAHAIARQEILCNMQDIVSCAAKLLKNKGRLCMIHQADRMGELLFCMRDVRIEPKRIQMVQPSAGKAPNLMLIEGVKNGRPGLKWLPPLIVFEKDGEYTDEMNCIYHRGKYADE